MQPPLMTKVLCLHTYNTLQGNQAAGSSSSWCVGADFPTDANACTKVVAYLEDRKVRFLPIEHREALRTPGAPAWGRAFLSYLRQLRCPHATHTTDVASGTTQALLLCWLVDHAIGIEFEDRGECGGGSGVVCCTSVC